MPGLRCADPILCYTDGRRKIFRHFSLATGFHKIRYNLVFNCGQCIFCRKKRAQELAIRCVLHASLYDHNCFLTLTYDEKRESYHNDFEYRDIQLFKKKLRRHCEYHHDKKIQVFNVHEYGKNGKKHWHLVVFNHDFKDKQIYTRKEGNNLYMSDELEGLWGHGFCTIGDVTEASALYQAQYTQKDLKYGHSGTSRRSHSKHSGIGREFFLRHYEQILRLGFIPFGGKKVPVPRYFEKLAHKHYSHFYAPENFEDTTERKKLYSKFKLDEADRVMADLFVKYHSRKEIFIEQHAAEFEAEIQPYIWTREKPDFAKSEENFLHDLSHKLGSTSF